jgi:hypothetical protein
VGDFLPTREDVGLHHAPKILLLCTSRPVDRGDPLLWFPGGSEDEELYVGALTCGITDNQMSSTHGRTLVAR